MKRTLFVLTVLAFGMGLSYFSFFEFPEEALDSVEKHGADLDDSVKYLEFTTGSSAKPFAASKVPNSAYLRFSPIS